MRNENEVLSSQNNHNPQLSNNFPQLSLNKSDSNFDLKQDLSKPKLNLNAQSYIPKFVRKVPEANSSEKPQENKPINQATTSVKNSVINKPVNPTYIPYQGGPSLNAQSIFFLNKV
jgi:hypothetical protein